MVDFLYPPNLSSPYLIKRKKIVILGAGLSGLSTSFFLKKIKIEAPIFEKEKECGGLCRSIKKDGFTFDFSGHLLHFRNHKTLSLVKNILDNNLVRHKRNAQVYAFNRFIPYPFQLNLHCLPKKIAKECIAGIITANNNGQSCQAKHFLAWINKKFGPGIARHFMVPYNKKFWKIPLESLTYSWAGRFIIRPPAEYFSKMCMRKPHRGLGYNVSFWYPKRGGIEQLPNALASRIKDTHLASEVYEIDLKKKIVRFKNGLRKKYDILISTLPLPELNRIINGLPSDVTTSIKQLRWLSIYNVNLGIERKIDSNCHWIYFPQKDISFFRVGFFNNFSSSLVPDGRSSLYAETSYVRSQDGFKKNITSRIKADLRKTGFLRQGFRIKCENINDIKYAYPVYDKNYHPAKDIILKFLNKNSIISCGRFGGWRYLSMEDVIIEGQNVANMLSNAI